jgi:LytS/YehU family sensor histidine kinase
MVLENSLHAEVSLKADIEALELYMEMERVRLIYGFNYRIETDPNLDTESTLVPPLIVQPFVENSIWHGLNGKTSKGNLFIKIMRHENMLKFTVEDDGVESTAAAKGSTMQSVKKKSLGMSLTRERLDVLNKTKNSHAHFNISDIRDEKNVYKGKRVELYIPYESENED